MSNAVITSTEKYMKIVFNDTSTNVTSYYSLNQIQHIEDKVDYVFIVMNTQTLNLVFDGIKGIKVDTINGVTLSDNADLAAMIAEML